ncbi:MAG: agmatine deiminase family protein [Thermodesulfobacteriota bacterium]|jgi:agmatine/peptidylarginine deiminase
MSEIVYFSDALKRYPEVFNEAVEFLKKNGIAVRLIEGTRNIWTRDFMPIQVGYRLIKFRYIPDKRYPQLKVPHSCYEQLYPIYSNIILDGGNVVRRGDKTILTKKVLKKNPGLKLTKLEKILQSEVTLIPIEPYASIGHSDGICHFLPNGSVLINDYESMPQYQTYHKRLVRALKGFSIETLVCAYSKCPRMSEKQFRKLYPLADVFCSSFGCYVNYLEIANLILLPGFGIVEDIEALTKIKQLYPNHKIRQLDFSQISMLGGCINCISWDVRINGNFRPER